ncbi:MAG: type II secretion system F family protein [Desulfobacula sp.]|jgi:tight adherence protein B|nr:type II secretion system F family protein [Desulfobacula sp.]
MDFVIISLIIFILALIIIELCLYAYRHSMSIKKAGIKKRIKKYTFVEDDFGSILKKRDLSDIPFLNRLLSSISFVRSLDDLVMKANVSQSIGFYVLLAALLGALGFLGGSFFLHTNLYATIIAIALFISPFLYLVNKKKKRVEKFQAQLHEALDLIARALRAGHSFTSSMKLAADEFKDPLGTEFEETIDQINFGVSVPAALSHLSERIDCQEIKYFVVAVIIQRQTGGNLAELIESLAHIVRERFKFEGKVRILSAEGRLSGVILAFIPFAIGGWLQISNPDFMKPLFEDEIGRIMLGIGGIMMVLGMITIKKMVEIEV